MTRRTRDLLDSRDGRMPAGQELAGKRVACGIDAGTSRLRRVTRQQKGQGKSKKQRRRDKTDGPRDVKLLIIDEIDETGEKVRTSCPWIDGTFGGPDEAMELLAMSPAPARCRRCGGGGVPGRRCTVDLGAAGVGGQTCGAAESAVAFHPGLLACGTTHRSGTGACAESRQGTTAAVPEVAEVAQGRPKPGK